jgi:CubicO group peptidase (beta-lactamase class C family)
MASVTKILSVTAVSLIALDSGKIGLHDKVSRYFPVPDHNRDLEIFHLLTHTTGVGHRNLTAAENNYDNIAQKVLELCGNTIGADVEYSCPAFILLGKVLEKVYGKQLDVLFKQMIAEPLGMTRSGFLPDADYPDGIVNSDVDPLLSATVNDYNCKYLGGVAGNAGVFSCISDVTRFVNMLLSNGKPLFSKNILDLASKNYTNGMSEARGLGFLYVDERYSQTGELFPVGSIGHCGHTGQSVFLNRESGLYVIILSDATVSTVKAFGGER